MSTKPMLTATTRRIATRIAVDLPAGGIEASLETGIQGFDRCSKDYMMKYGL